VNSEKLNIDKDSNLIVLLDIVNFYLLVLYNIRKKVVLFLLTT